MIISMDKKYTNGLKQTVEVLCVDAAGEYTVITKTSGVCETYKINGSYSDQEQSSALDLIEIGDDVLPKYIPKPNEVIAVWDYEGDEPSFDKFFRFGDEGIYIVKCKWAGWNHYRALTDEERGIDQ